MDLSALTNSPITGSSILNNSRSTTSSSSLQGSDFQSMLSSMLYSSGLSGASSSASPFGAASSDSSTSMLMLPLMFAMMEQLLTKQMELLQAGKLAPTTPSTEASTPTTLDTVQSSGVSNLIAAASGQKQAKELKQPAVLLANQARAQALAQSAAQKDSSASAPSTSTSSATSTSTPIEISPVSASSTSGHAAPYGEPAHGPLTQGFTSGHNGLDIGVVVGTPIHSTMDGKVIYAGWSPIGYGNLVIVQNGDYQTYYAHLSKIPVTNGQTVQAGSVIGLSGSTGNSTGPHLHYEIRYKGKNLDPTSLTLNKAI